MKVLFVCMGNICRSPTAEGVMLHLLQQQGLATKISVDSAGTHGYHIGAPPDARTQATARRAGVELSGLRARQVSAADCELFDVVLAMDRNNLQHLQAICPPAHQHKLQLLMVYAPTWQSADVPDPYYGGTNGFERVLDMVHDACQGLLTELRTRLD
jgi:protein-tyrosine phosphatase